MLMFFNANPISFFLKLFSDSLRHLALIPNIFLWQVNILWKLPSCLVPVLTQISSTIPYKYLTDVTPPWYWCLLALTMTLPWSGMHQPSSNLL